MLFVKEKKQSNPKASKKVDLTLRQPAPRIGWGLLCFILSILSLVAFFDYNPAQSHFVTTAFADQLHTDSFIRFNLVGKLGATIVFYALFYFGCSGWLIPAYCFVLAYKFWFRLAHTLRWWKYTLMVTMLGASCGIFAMIQLYCMPKPFQSNYFPKGLGGVVGSLLFNSLLYPNIGAFGSFVILFSFLVLGGIFVFVLSDTPLQSVHHRLQLLHAQGGKLTEGFAASLKRVELPNLGHLSLKAFERLKALKAKKVLEEELFAEQEIVVTQEQDHIATHDVIVSEEAVIKPVAQPDLFVAVALKKDKKAATIVSPVIQTQGPVIVEEPHLKIVAEEKIEKAELPLVQKKEGYFFPTLDLLQEPSRIESTDQEDYEKTALTLVSTLKEFSIEVAPGEVHKGPVITRYEVKPASGVRVEKIASLDKNLAMALKAISVRILAPVPGKGCVGVEIPNKNPLPVCLREIIESKAWAKAGAQIPIVLGKEVTGKPLVADLTKMPHLLIAGSTGSGKTVCINTIIASLLYHAAPEDLRFIMVDPKIVEMQLYNDLPHMLIPVVTDPKKVPNALKWLIGEMESRYQRFAKVGARNIASYNEKVLNNTIVETDLINGFKKLPYIVCIIDELADLMMVSPADIETSIARLAQLARAAGIHLIIATQRPSVNVITGVIKANLPCRIAFKVASKVDSRTILDGGGADQLIGRGDMLFTPPGSSDLVRVQGAFVSDREIVEIVEAVKRNGPPAFVLEVQRQIEAATEEEDEEPLDVDDKLIPQALEIWKTASKPSVSILQRRLRIGYNRAARIAETLEAQGYIKLSNKDL